MHKFYTLKNLTQEELNELALERNSLEQERDKYKQMYEMEKALFIEADLKIERAIEYNNQIIKDTEVFYRPTSDTIYSGDTLIDIAEQNLEILKGDTND